MEDRKNPEEPQTLGGHYRRMSVTQSVHNEVSRGDQLVERQKRAKRLELLLNKHKEVAEILDLLRELGV